MMNPTQATAYLNRLAIVESQIFITPHARTRAPERGKYPLLASQIIACIRHGMVTEGPYDDPKWPGKLKCTVTRVRDGEHHECVVSFDPAGPPVVVITAYEWRRRVR
ncbi:hypothetical protein GE253_11995 [Niveispirillum sp. SYP-B3756]|uniref:DUF4258 domain-containing protein n=1 Tax=Niveispirillum sp. SYP-B3756 TaxID=2662178 RepID=UPI0012926C6D|nr:DUF4258 domain-containing protein [Niveispirillum sp. SYP-B3756]MQP66062.1 hypothetical protein [Niveispirillum sp. SYP-B3756]